MTAQRPRPLEELFAEEELALLAVGVRAQPVAPVLTYPEDGPDAE